MGVLDGINHSNWDPDLRFHCQVVLLSLHQKLWPPLQHKEILQPKQNKKLQLQCFLMENRKTFLQSKNFVTQKMFQHHFVCGGAALLLLSKEGEFNEATSGGGLREQLDDG